jgi:2-succinyl-5-enolpyruvyl-6-hydroxy-3-cyclohexene-1-carboxylate synthase
VNAFFAEETTVSELGIVHYLSSWLTAEWNLFVGNSMPIRDVDALWTGQATLFANRGVSGIDGNIATAVGIAKATGRPTCVLVGDLALLHDLNSLALLQQVKTPFLLCVVNNGGGGIFSFVPTAQHPLIASAHGWSFEQAAALFHLEYRRIQHLCAWTNLPATCIIEIPSCRTANLLHHKQFACALSSSETQKVLR